MSIGWPVVLLIIHGLAAVALLGGLTHQSAALLRGRKPLMPSSGFVTRYAAVRGAGFSRAVVLLYAVTFLLGAVIYPVYRTEVRIPFEEMGMGTAVGVFEIKEHWGGIGIGLLPWYAHLWKNDDEDGERDRARLVITLTLAAIVWFDFIAGHLLNNIRGLP